MKYFRNPEDDQVYAYDILEQQEYIERAIANGWKDITGSWPPPEEPITELTPAEKLANAGLTVNELKSLLGL